MTYREIYEEGRKRLDGAGIEEAALDARLLLEHVCGTGHNDLLAHGDRKVSDAQREEYARLLGIRESRAPLQHITGSCEFMGLEFQVNAHTLIPRQDTETLVEEVLRQLHDGMDILDMCTGSGCILISLLRYSNGCRGLGVDISPRALEVAGRNKERILGETDQVGFLESDMFDRVQGVFDILVSNPPYIPTEEIGGLMPEVRDHEPVTALDGGKDGLAFYRIIASEGKKHLRRGGWLYLEIGHDQGEAVACLLRTQGYGEVEIAQDLTGADRVVFGCLMG